MEAEELLARLVARLPDFIVESHLGQGGMGVVLLGTQKELGRKVAIKVLFTERADEKDVARFRREAQMYAQLRHPNLVQVYDADATGVPAYIVLEYIKGRDLKEAILALDAPPFTRVAGPLASAVAYVHERGIFHRDIKSANVMLRESGAPVLMDFGLAKREDVNATALTEDGARVGTPLYMPPEIILGKGVTSAAADVYMLGLTLYELALGRTMAMLDTEVVTVVQRVTRGMPKLSDIGGGVDEGVEKLIHAAIALDPKDRPTAQELADQLMPLFAGQTLSEPVPAEGAPRTSGATLVPGARRSGVTRRPSGRVSSARITTSAAPSGVDEGRTRRIAFAAVGIGALIAAGVAWRATRVAHVDPQPTPTASVAAASVTTPRREVGLEPRRTGKLGDEFLLVPAGSFTMGAATPEHPHEAPPHRVHLDAYYIGRTEVSNALYDRFCKETSRKPRERYTRYTVDFDKPDHPVVGVSWHDAVAYATWVGQRLPTEAEWEKAARGTDGRRFPWGNKLPNGHCNHADVTTTTEIFGDDLAKAAKFQSSDGFAYTSPVGRFTKGASPFGALDMAGNAQEWCADWYAGDYYAKSPERNPTGPATGKVKLSRGGCWENMDRSIRTTHREPMAPDKFTYKYGFRTVLDP